MKKKKTKINGLSLIFILFILITPLFAGEVHHLAKKGDIKRIKSLLKQSPQLVNSKDQYHWTPLHLAALKRNHKIFELLLETNPTWLNSKNRFGITPLHYAAIGGNLQAAGQLIGAGAHVNARTRKHPTMLLLF
jgi:ankyrin repeat protein